jgi:hypothetical protein
MKILQLYLVFFLIPFTGKSQSINEKILIEGGYTYFNRNFADVGVKYLIDKKNLTIGTNILIGASDNKILAVPELSATQYFDAKNFPFPFARVSISSKTITPQVGFSFLIGELGVGYGLGFDKSTTYKNNGFRVQLNFNIPLKLKMKIM